MAFGLVWFIAVPRDILNFFFVVWYLSQVGLISFCLQVTVVCYYFLSNYKNIPTSVGLSEGKSIRSQVWVYACYLT